MLEDSFFKSNASPAKIEVQFFSHSADIALGKSLGAALPALGKPRPSLLFYLDLHSI